MRSVVDKVDIAMKQARFSRNSHIKYISFANSTRNKRIGALQLNKCINIKLKYECLENVNALELAKYNGVEQIVSEVIMSIKSKGIPLFYSIEQGTGRNSNNVYIYFKGTMAVEGKDWIRKNYGTKFTIPKKKNTLYHF